MDNRLIYDNYFSPLVRDYLSGNEKLEPFRSFTPDIEGLHRALSQRRFPQESRDRLREVLTGQHEALGKTHAAVKENIAALGDPRTFTVTTGHQICLMTGPLYFIFKIASVVKLTRQLRAAYPDYRFVPVYWAATEDHDFEEIRSVFLHHKTYTWEPPAPVSGATGRISTDGLAAFFEGLETAEGEKLSYNRIFRLFKKAWTEQPDLSAAIRKAVHDLFGHLGVVGIDADDRRFKSACSGWIARELKEQFSFEAVKADTRALHEAGYKTQVEPREINLFYLRDGLRERLVKTGDTWAVNQTDLRFSETGLDEELSRYPERFSPNVVLRPLYQESILPNIAYIGGPAEIAYWLQLKGVFEATGTDFPVLVPRDGFLFASEKDVNRFERLGFTAEDMLRDADTNLRDYIRRTRGEELSVEAEKETLHRLFSGLKHKFAQADNGAEKAFSSIEKKLEKELDKLEKKALKFAARKEVETAAFLADVHQSWFPGGTLSERKNSIIEYWGILGNEPAEALTAHADPLRPGLKIITY